MKKVFISYKREEQDFAQLLRNALSAEGIDVWWDQKLQAGELWSEKIDKALLEAGAVVTIWSELSVASEWVKHEASVAKVLGRLVPVRIDECQIPESLKSAHASDLRGWKGDVRHPEFRELVSAIKAKIRPTPTPLKPPVLVQSFLAIVFLSLGALVGYLFIGPAPRSGADELSFAELQPAELPPTELPDSTWRDLTQLSKDGDLKLGDANLYEFREECKYRMTILEMPSFTILGMNNAFTVDGVHSWIDKTLMMKVTGSDKRQRGDVMLSWVHATSFADWYVYGDGLDHAPGSFGVYATKIKVDEKCPPSDDVQAKLDGAGSRTSPRRSNNPLPVAESYAPGWYGATRANNPDKEKQLEEVTGGFRRVDVSNYNTFYEVCTSLGMRCERVIDWEGHDKACSDPGDDGSRLAYCG